MAGRKIFTVPDMGEPLEFEIAGHVFRAHPRIASGVMLDLGEVISGSTNAEEGQGPEIGELITALRKFFKAALYPDDFPRWEALLDDPEVAIPFQTLNDIAGWLAGEYAGDRPTGQPSSDTSASVSSGDVSMATTTPPASISLPSPQTEPST